jgi:hypothetical protein
VGEGGRLILLIKQGLHYCGRIIFSGYCSTFLIPLYISDKSKEDYTTWSLYLVFLGVTLPDLAFKPDSTFLPFFEGHENNAHCLTIAVNALAGAIFAYYGEQHQRERMKEFLVVCIL